MTAPTGPTVLLVHGAWHGAWCWVHVVGALAAAGVDARALDLPGHGDDTGPLSDLHGDAARVREYLDAIDGPVVLLGHSYGGAVITEAGDHPAVARLVYLAAVVLDAGETAATMAATEPDVAAISHEGRPDLGSGFRVTDGVITLDPAVAAACLYNDCDAATTTWALERLSGQPFITLRQQPRAVAWRSKPSTYVVCAGDMGIHPDLERVLARRCTESLEWTTGHSPFLSRPDLVAGLLIDQVRSVSG